MDGPQGRCGSGRSMMPKAGPRGQRPDSPRSPFLPGPRWPFQGPGGRGLPRERGRAEVSPQLRQHLCRWPCSSVLLPSRTADNRKRQPRRAGNVLCAHAGHRAAPEAKASVAAPRPGSPLPAPGGGAGRLWGDRAGSAAVAGPDPDAVAGNSTLGQLEQGRRGDSLQKYMAGC